MVLLIEGPDIHPHWAQCLIPRGIALACVAMGAAFTSLRPGPVLRAMFFVDFVTMLGSEGAVHVYLSALSPRSKRVLLLLILLVDTSTLVAMLSELPEGWAAAIGRGLLFFLAFSCSAGAWATLVPGAAGAMGLPEEDEWSDEWDDEAYHLPAAPAPPVHWPAPLELPNEIAARSRAELPEAFVCPLTMGLMRLPAVTPRGTSYEYEALASWIGVHGRYPAGEAGALVCGALAPNLALRNLIDAWLREQRPPPPPAAAPAALPPPPAQRRASRSPARRRR